MKAVRLSKTIELPKRVTEGSAGRDLLACFDSSHKVIIYNKFNVKSELTVNENSVVVLKHEDRALIPNGFKVELLHEEVIDVRSTSGNSLKKGVRVINSPGTVDEDFRGEVCTLLINDSHVNFEIRHGDKVAQMVVGYVNMEDDFEEVETLEKTDRGEKGFGEATESKQEEVNEGTLKFDPETSLDDPGNGEVNTPTDEQPLVNDDPNAEPAPEVKSEDDDPDL